MPKNTDLEKFINSIRSNEYATAKEQLSEAVKARFDNYIDDICEETEGDK